MTIVILLEATALELSNDEAWASIDDDGDTEITPRHSRRYAKSHFQNGVSDWAYESKMMRRNARASGSHQGKRRHSEEILDEVPLSELRELGMEWRDSLMSNSSGSGDFRWGNEPMTRGAQGPQGPRGPAGKKGGPGKEGSRGPKGDTGVEGDKGPQGEQGPMQDMKPPPQNLASVSLVGALIAFNLVSALIVYAVVSGKLNEKQGSKSASKSMEEAEEGEEEAVPEEAFPEEEEAFPEEAEEAQPM